MGPGRKGSTSARAEHPTRRKDAALRYNEPMRVTTGRVVNGRIEVPDEQLAEGLVVTILAPEARGTFTLGPEAEAALLASIEEADRGDTISGEELLRELRRD